jgi:hypothetical protein
MIKLSLRVVMASSLASGLLASCSSSSSPSPSPGGSVGPAGVDDGAIASSLSSSQLGQLCDWSLTLYGATYGANVTFPCDGGASPTGHVAPYASQAACVDATTLLAQKCGATVAQIEACWQSAATLVKDCNVLGASNGAPCQTLAAVPSCVGIANGGGTYGYGTP